VAARRATCHPLRDVETLDGLPWQHVIIFEKKGK
jgi:hypothetical protein